MLIAVVVVVVVVVVAVAVLLVVLRMRGSVVWARETHGLAARLGAAQIPQKGAVVDFRTLIGLPVPVRRFFHAALSDGQPVVRSVRLQQAGSIDMGTATPRWKPFTADQYAVTGRPGFDWDARVRLMPGLDVRVHDAYAAGEGVLHVALGGLITLARVRGQGELAEGELLRFLAEAAWYPTALLPDQGVQWEPIDDRSARGLLIDGANRAALVFHFGDDGLIASVYAQKRGRSVGRISVPTPWHGRFWHYERRGGMCVPLEGEVAWGLPEGTRPYWRGRVTGIVHAFA